MSELHHLKEMRLGWYAQELLDFVEAVATKHPDRTLPKRAKLLLFWMQGKRMCALPRCGRIFERKTRRQRFCCTKHRNLGKTMEYYAKNGRPSKVVDDSKEETQ